MKALSIRQPWTWAILHAGKRIENRDWRGCSYRGPLLIHAAKGCTIAEWDLAAMWMTGKSLVNIAYRPTVPPLRALDRGGIVGVCRLVDVVTSPAAADRIEPGHGRWFCGPLGLVLADVRPLPFVPFKGALGFFDVPRELVS